MKAIRLLIILVSFATLTINAQNGQSPKGLYHLKKFIYEDGRERVPGFSQYKYAADSVGLLISFRAARSVRQWSSLNIEIRENEPLKNTGEQPQGADGHGNQIFNVNDQQFYFKWYNQNWPNMSQLNEFITEVYVKEGIEKEVAQAFNMLENKTDTKANKFCGWWIRVGAAANPDGSGKHSQVPTIWKAYSPTLSMVVNMAGNGMALGCNTTNTIQYENDTTIYEIGNRCDIHWLNDHCHTLTYTQANGMRITEIWERGGLPLSWQEIFHSDVAPFRDGTACLRDAAEAAKKGDMQAADRYFREAIHEKHVPLVLLCQTTPVIASYLLEVKGQYQECVSFCERQLKYISDYVDAGNEHDAASRLYVHQTEMCRAVAVYRSGNEVEGRKLMDERLSIIDSEISRFKAVTGMEGYVNALYHCNLVMYHLGYDIFGAKATLLYLDALSLMAPAVTSNNKPMVLNCRANCYLLEGDKENARKLWQQIKELNADYMKNQPDSNPLKKMFGE